ncbi:MAG: prephenate dehydratase domain-containing protein [Eubacteriales bacterium]|nr:prephenate dehydratase domain-containing protein [Eubacteriales bacterium]
MKFNKEQSLNAIDLEIQKLLERKMRIQQHVRDVVEDPHVVYQGAPGAYSEMAAIKFFGSDVKTTGYPNFRDSFIALKNETADYAVLPIENSSTGAIRQVYDLLVEFECYMVGETSVPIAHCLVGMPGATLDDIDSVYSHEQGLFQCEKFLDQYPSWERVPFGDTAGSAKMVSETGDIHKAAICSSRAAELYGLDILKEGIQTRGKNTTRFVVVSPIMELRDGRDKLCLSFAVKHDEDSLHRALSIFANHKIKLIHVESRPVIEKNWEYTYFLELKANLTDPGMEDIMFSVRDVTSDLRIFGNYVSNL